MAKRHYTSSAQGPRVAMNAKVILDKDIDFSDIPESTEPALKRARRVGSPATGRAKQLIAMRVNPVLLAKNSKNGRASWKTLPNLYP